MASREAEASGTVSEIVSNVSIDQGIVQWKRGAIGGGDGGGMGEGSIEWGRGLLDGFSSMPTASLRVEVTVIVVAWVGCVWLASESRQLHGNEERSGAKRYEAPRARNRQWKV